MLSRVKGYLEKAENCIKDDNCDDFLVAIGSAEAFADNNDILSDILYVKAKGLFTFKKFGSSLTAIEEALKLTNEPGKGFKLMKGKALILAYKGNYQESLQLFKELVAGTKDSALLTEVHINIAWVMLEEYRREPDESVLHEIKFYLDSANENIEELDDLFMKKLILNNYAEYCKLKKDYDTAIKMLERMIPLCKDYQVCEVYHDLAQIYMELDNDEMMEKYLHDAEVYAARFDNDMEVARTLYTSAVARMKKGDYIHVMDSLCTAFYNFVGCGAYNYAYDCFTKMNEASEYLKRDCTTVLKSQFRSMFENTVYKQLI